MTELINEQLNPEVNQSNPIETIIDEGDKKLKAKPRDLRELGLNPDPTAVKGPVDENGKPKYVFRWCHDMHRKPRGGTGSWEVADWKFIKNNNIEFPANPVSEHMKKQADSKVYMMDHFLCYRPSEVNQEVRSIIHEKSNRHVNESENMDALAEGIRNQFGARESVKIMDAMVKVRGRKYF